MSARMTVVFDDEDLYREAKVHAAQTGVSLKTIIETAVRAYLKSSGRQEDVPEIKWDWDAYDRAQADIEERWRALSESRPDDHVSDGLRLHDYSKQTVLMVAEEAEAYRER